MSGYTDHNKFKTDYNGVNKNTREIFFTSSVNNSGPSTTNNHGITVPGSGSGNALSGHQIRDTVPTMSRAAMHQQPQSLLYDMSSFDPLQAQALQLSASAGLTTADILAAAAAAPAITSGPITTCKESNSNVGVGANNSNMPAAGVGAGIPQPAPSFSASLSQTSANAAASTIAAASISIS